ncbi:adhesin [Lysobacteraceae bacterium NML93-0792]|nr:adhesin [Xanthomonadaceae bacterium NML93-0792]PBS15481.1 adhesin [Xanthomonadaceae bacterium NML93-0793]PBS20375.1 adhesin [Xanthomonadaceae bacterium NML93-0831]
MKTMKWTVLALAVSAAAAGTAHAQVVDWQVVDYDITVDDTRNYETNVTNTSTNLELNATADLALTATADLSLRQNLDQSLVESTERTTTETIDRSLTETRSSSDSFDRSVSVDQSLDEAHRIRTNQVYEVIDRSENVNSDIRRERNEHGVSVNLEKDLSLSSDIAFSGDPTITGDIDLDSAAIAVIDNRQSVSNNFGLNEVLENDASIADDVASEASGNLLFNVAAGDNNVQDNAAALSAADAGFAFGLADAEVFVNQAGSNNTTINEGVTNTAGVGGNAFSSASGNIGVNVASGNNNAQKNAMAASVATAAYAQASVSSNQMSSGNETSNAGSYQRFTDTVDVSLSGTMSGGSIAVGMGAYEGESSGRTTSRGNAYQQSNFYADLWSGAEHPAGNSTGHADFDSESQGAVANPYRQGVGGLAFDTDARGSYEGTESGDLAFIEMGYTELEASLSGEVSTTRWVAVAATNTAGLSGSAFSSASGNIGVNVAAGTGNLQANSLSMAVAQPGAAAPPGGGE